MNEIETLENLEKNSVRKYWLGYVIHNLVVKNIFAKSSEKLQNKIMDLIIGKPKSILDVSCGDDDLIIKICRKLETNICVANDLSPKLTSFLNDKGSNITYTNFNILSQPFTEKFDLVICKNTLHHISNNYQSDLIQYLLKISKQLIIVDIEDPRNSTYRSKIWNWYYQIFLGDKGNYFLSFDKFKTILSSPQKEFVLGKIPTLKGEYMYATYYPKDFNSNSSLA